MNILLETRKLRKTFGGIRAVDDASLVFRSGEITAVIGPNGSGKTTLIDAITGLVPFESGAIIVGDSFEMKNIRSARIAGYGITRTFQKARLVEQISVLDNVLLALATRPVFHALFERPSKPSLSTAESILKKIGLWEKRAINAELLSYGQRKLLEIARAVAMNARVYFFDEPFAGLFTETKKNVSDILTGLARSGAAVVLVEHNMEIVRSLADTVYVLDGGKVIAEGSPVNVLAETAVVDAYLGK